MNFRDYASRIRTQATAAARNIPTFDDMAANDEYIHSEEFNVRGKTRGTPGTSTGSTNAPPGGVEPDETSSMGSWSLLDRPPAHLRSPEAVVPRGKFETSSIQGSLQGGLDSATMSANTSVSSEAPTETQRRSSRASSGLPLLSVVASTLNANRFESNDYSKNPGGGALDSRENDSSQADDDSMDSELDDDEDDPIMSMIQKDKPPPRERRRVISKAKPERSIDTKTDAARTGIKSSQRFLENLDERVSISAGEERMEAGLAEPPTSNEPTKAFGMKAPLGGWLQNAAKAQFDRMLRRPDTSSEGSTSTPPNKAQAPLARERPPKTKTLVSPADDFQRAASTAFMGDEELAQLARLKGDSKLGTCSALVGLFRNYQSFAFVIFTLILAVFVYFFQGSADDVS